MGTVSFWYVLVGIGAGTIFGLFWGWIRGLQMAGEALAHAAQKRGLDKEFGNLLDKLNERV